MEKNKFPIMKLKLATALAGLSLLCCPSKPEEFQKDLGIAEIEIDDKGNLVKEIYRAPNSGITRVTERLPNGKYETYILSYQQNSDGSWSD